MAHYIHHARSSAAKFGGIPEDYFDLHKWMDESKAAFPGPLHRMLRHHMEGVWAATQVFGEYVTNSEGKRVPVTYVLEQHLREDLGWLPTFHDWCSQIGDAMEGGHGFPSDFHSRGPAEPASKVFNLDEHTTTDPT